jgi:Tfp pilus assembly PilM family ATPase
MSEILGRLFGVLSTLGPSVGVEIAADCVTGVALTWVKSTPKVIGHARVRLPTGVLAPSAAATNVIDRDVVVEAVRQVLKQLPRRVTRIGLVVPDSVGKVSFVKFDQIPGKPADLARLVAWQVRKAVPFRVEDAQFASTPGARLPGGGQEFVVTLIRRDIVEEYEGVCRSAGAHAGLVDLATFNPCERGHRHVAAIARRLAAPARRA